MKRIPLTAAILTLLSAGLVAQIAFAAGPDRAKSLITFEDGPDRSLNSPQYRFFSGSVDSPENGCVGGRRVVIYAVRDGQDSVFARTSTDSNGHWQKEVVRVKKKTGFYALVEPSIYRPKVVAGPDLTSVCEADVSSTVEVDPSAETVEPPMVAPTPNGRLTVFQQGVATEGFLNLSGALRVGSVCQAGRRIVIQDFEAGRDSVLATTKTIVGGDWKVQLRGIARRVYAYVEPERREQAGSVYDCPADTSRVIEVQRR